MAQRGESAERVIVGRTAFKSVWGNCGERELKHNGLLDIRHLISTERDSKPEFFVSCCVSGECRPKALFSGGWKASL
jgi:hypothetical protein